MRSPWLDRTGKFSPLKTVTFAALFVPGLVTAVQFGTGAFPAEPLKAVIHATGLWAIRFLMISLAITPARQIFRLPRLILVRRMIGVAAFAYALIHLTAFAANEMFDLTKVVTEIVLRIYLTIGFTVLVALSILATTSTDGAVRRLGAKRWQILHRIVYVAGTFALVHYFMQSKLEVTEPTIFAGFFIWLMGFRLMSSRLNEKTTSPLALALLAVATALLTGLGEALYFAIVRHVAFTRVLEANIRWAGALRPAHIVLFLGLAIAMAAWIRLLAKSRQPAPSPHTAA